MVSFGSILVNESFIAPILLYESGVFCLSSEHDSIAEKKIALKKISFIGFKYLKLLYSLDVFFT
jgi:hypothetical protein